MKTHPFYQATVALLFCAANAVYGQVSPAAPPKPVPAPPPAPAAVKPLPPEPPDPATKEWRAMKETMVRANKQVQEEVAEARAAQAKAYKDVTKLGGGIKWLSGTKTSRVLVVPSGEPNRETVANLEEDLAVMGRVLEKSVDSKERHPSALGMDLLTFAGPAAAQHLYVGGHGAIFTLRVRFPLEAPAKETKSEEPESDTSSTWEEARREVFGSGDRGQVFGLLKEWDSKEKEEYDAKKVERLKESIIDALKNGTHIRDLAPDERVTVVVTGGGTGTFETRVRNYGRGGSGGGTGGGYGGGGTGGGYGGTITRSEEVRHGPRTDMLTIQAKKADIDAYAKGKMDTDEFRKKVTIVNY